MSLGHAIIMHRRSKTARKRARYLVEEKTKPRGLGAVEYMVSQKPGEQTGKRVIKYWGVGFQATGDVEIDSAELMAGTRTGNRSEVVDLLVSVEPSGNRGRDEQQAIDLTYKLMSTFFPGLKYLACAHGDTPNNAHVHIVLPNDDMTNRHRSIQIDRETFLRMRRDLEFWSGMSIASGWGRGKRVERRFAKLKKVDVREALKTKLLVVKKRDTKGNVTHLSWRPRKGELAKTIRWWVVVREAGVLDYDLVELLIEISIMHRKMDAMLSASARFRSKLVAEQSTLQSAVASLGTSPSHEPPERI